MLIAIQPDFYANNDSSSPTWTRLLLEAGHQVREVDVYRADILEQLQGCQGFMWRHAHVPQMRQVARRLLPVIERELGLAVYPDQATCWHYDDKIAQAYLQEAAGIPTPQTWIWFEREQAEEWARQAEYPLVLKLWAGAGSRNVQLVPDVLAALKWIRQLFEAGVVSLEGTGESPLRWLLQKLSRSGPLPWEVHRGYVLFQEYLTGNDFDTRVTVIGDRAFGFRRFNRPGDFRASGSGKIDWNPEEISPDFIQLAFAVAERLGCQSCAIDGLRRDGSPVVAEISYTYASWAVEACPGHWDANLNWHEGQMWPEEAQVQDFLARLQQRQTPA